MTTMKPQRGVVTLVPDHTQMRMYVERGLTQQQIADEWEKDSGTKVSRSAIAMALERYDLKTVRPRPRYEDMLPWKVKTEHLMKSEARLLRWEARRRRGEAIGQRELTWLTHWRQELDAANAVVTYDPDTVDGFHWIARTPEDTDIIRRPKDK